jgi:hypothetical protein
MRSPADELGLAAFIRIVEIDQRSQDALVGGAGLVIEMAAILLAGPIAQDLERLALAHIGAAGGGEAAVERVDRGVFDQPVHRRPVRGADRIAQARAVIVGDQRRRIARLGDQREEGAFLCAEQAGEQRDMGRFAEPFDGRERAGIAVWRKVHRRDQRQHLRAAAVPAGFRRQPGERGGPVARTGKAAGEQIGIGPDRDRMPGLARPADQLAALGEMLLDPVAAPIHVGEREQCLGVARCSQPADDQGCIIDPSRRPQGPRFGKLRVRGHAAGHGSSGWRGI